MTVEVLDVISNPFTPNGVTTAYPFSFQVGDTDEVEVQIDGATVDSALYSVSLNDDGTGEVVFFSPPTGSTLYLLAAPTFGQPSTLQNQGPYFQRTLERMVDRVARGNLWMKSRLDRIAPSNLLTANLNGKFQSWDAEGNPILVSGTGADGSLRTELATGVGSLLVGWLQAGVGAVVRSIYWKLRDTLHVEDFGAIGDGIADDYPAFAKARAALIAAGGGTIRLGRKTYLLSSGSILLDTGSFLIPLRVKGDSTGTKLRQVGEDLPLFKIGTTQTVRSAAITKVNLECGPDAGHVIEVGSFGCTLLEVQANITQTNADKSIIHAPEGKIFDSHFHHGDWYVEQDHTVPPVYIRSNDTNFNENVFERLRCSNATNTPFFDVAMTVNGSWLTNDTFRHINFEVCRGGGIKFANARGWTFQNLTFWDAQGAYTGHLIHCADNTYYSSISNTFQNVQRHGDSLAAGIRDIFLEDGDGSVVINCYTPIDIGPSYDWNNLNVTVFGPSQGHLNNTQTLYINGNELLIAGVQVLGPRVTGFQAMTGTADKTVFATYDAPDIAATYDEVQVQALANKIQETTRRLKAIDDAMRAHGLTGS